MSQAVFQAIAARDFTTAVALARQAVETEASPAAYHALGLALQSAGEANAAAEALDQAIAMAPQDAAYHLARASLALSQGDTERVDAELHSAIDSNPNQLGAYVFAAHLALSRGNADEAEKQLKLAQRVNPEHPIVLAIEGSIAELRGDGDKAVKLLAVAAQASPEDPLILSSLGLAYLRAGNHAFAEQALRNALSKRPELPRLRWALIEALRRQERIADLPAELEALLEQQPNDRRALALLGDCLLRQRQVELALQAYRRLLDIKPRALGALDGVVDLLSRVGLLDRARALVEELLAAEPDQDELWQRRVALDAGNPAQIDDALSRWRAALPNSPIMHGVCAQVAEARGDLSAAEAAADQSLALEPTLVGPLQVKLRALLRRDPRGCLALAEKISQDGKTDYGRRLGAMWQGFALDRLGRGNEAAAQWRAAHAIPGGPTELPPLTAVTGSSDASADAQPARLLWGPPGSRVREVVGLLRRVENFAMLDDRLGRGPRQDGLWPPRADGAIARSAGWRAMLERAGINPDQALDWLPHWDGRVDAVMPEALLIAVIADPRDLLLNALVFGGPQAWPMPGPKALAEWLASALNNLAERQARAPERCLLIRAAELQANPAAAIGKVCTALGIAAAPHVEGLDEARVGPGGIPLCFAPGHWRQVAEGFAEEFALLAPVAARLGFAEQ